MAEEQRVQVNVRIEPELATRLDQRIDELAQERGGGARPSRSEVVRMALIAFLNRPAGRKR